MKKKDHFNFMIFFALFFCIITNIKMEYDIMIELHFLFIFYISFI